jgi:hypothetical protein
VSESTREDALRAANAELQQYLDESIAKILILQHEISRKLRERMVKWEALANALRDEEW